MCSAFASFFFYPWVLKPQFAPAENPMVVSETLVHQPCPWIDEHRWFIQCSNHYSHTLICMFTDAGLPCQSIANIFKLIRLPNSRSICRKIDQCERSKVYVSLCNLPVLQSNHCSSEIACVDCASMRQRAFHIAAAVSCADDGQSPSNWCCSGLSHRSKLIRNINSSCHLRRPLFIHEIKNMHSSKQPQ